MWDSLIAFAERFSPDTIKTFIATVAGCISGMVATLMGEHVVLFYWLFGFVVADYVTGMYAAKCTRTFSSRVGFKGLVKKFVILAIAVGFHGLDQILDMPFIGAWAIGALSINELISILENIEKAGLGSIIPKRIRVLLDSVQEKHDQKIKEKFPGATT